jgi:hypothetical protein
MKNKLILLIILLATLMLSGCEHNHDYKWVMGSSPSLAFEMCDSCFHVRNIEEEYSSPVVSKSVVGGPEAFLSSDIDFVAEVDSGIYDYNEEFDIRLTVSMYTSYVKEGPLYVKLAESPYYEIVGDSEFIVSDFGNQDSREQVNEFVFRVKPTNQCSSVEAFDFKIKFTPTDQLKLSPYENYAWYRSPDEEYFYGFYKLSFINDSVGMLINDGEGKTKTFYDSINREYKNGTLDKDSYIDRLYEYNLNDSVNLEVSYVNGKASQPYFKYSSKNIRAEFYLKEDLEYLISLFDDRTEEPSDILSKKLINILYENGYITEEEYKNEIKYIENNPTSRRSYIIYHQFIPFSLYVKMNQVDFIYEDEGLEYKEHDLFEELEPLPK